MPTIVTPDNYHEWLDNSNQNWDALKHLLSSKPIRGLEIYPVSTAVNRAQFKRHTCVQPL